MLIHNKMTPKHIYIHHNPNVVVSCIEEEASKVETLQFTRERNIEALAGLIYYFGTIEAIKDLSKYLAEKTGAFDSSLTAFIQEWAQNVSKGLHLTYDEIIVPVWRYKDGRPYEE